MKREKEQKKWVYISIYDNRFVCTDRLANTTSNAIHTESQSLIKVFKTKISVNGRKDDAEMQRSITVSTLQFQESVSYYIRQ